MWGLRFVLCVLGGVVALGGCQKPTLGRDDTLIVAFEPSTLYPLAAAATPASVATERACQDGGAALVRVFGALNDGTPASDATVNLWLSPAGGLTLLPITQATPELGRLAVTLDGTGTGSACLFPGPLPETAMVHAQSGIVAMTAALNVIDRRIPDGGSLLLSAVAQTSDSQVPARLSCGGASPAACVPGQARRASVLLSGVAGSVGAVPDGATVILSASLGWLVAGTECGVGGNSQLRVPLQQGAAAASWCFGDGGGDGVLTARSGGVVATAPLHVPAVPATLILSSGVAAAKVGDTLKLTALVQSCAGAGVAGAPVLLSVTAGQLTLAEGPLVRTEADGSVTVTGTVGAVPLKVSARLPQSVDPGCSVDVGVKP